MALELFKPFVMKKLVDAELAQNIKSAKRMVERRRPQVWDVLEEAIKEHPVLLNRAPTLHRLGIQAFEPVLVEGKAIQIHPLVCTAFNADFDGDQMAVHLPLSAEAQAESRVLMLSANNVLSPAHGRPLVTPDPGHGHRRLLPHRAGRRGQGRGPHRSATSTRWSGPTRTATSRCTPASTCATDDRAVTERRADGADAGRRYETTAGRLFFNEALPADEVDYVNERVDKKVMGHIVDHLAHESAKGVVATSLDAIKNLCFRYAAKSGITISIDDVKTPAEKAGILDRHEVEAEKVEDQFRRGIITDGERRQKEVEIWTKATDLVREDDGGRPQGRAVQPHRDDGGLGCPRQHDAGPPDRRHARPGGQPPWRHDPPPDQVQLP